MILLLLTAILLAYTFLLFLGPFPIPFHLDRTFPSNPREHPSCPASARNDFSRNSRKIFHKQGCIAQGHPSAGGTLLLPIDVVLAQHLDLPRQTQSLRAQQEADEDIFCHRLRLLGAKWWANEDGFLLKSVGLDQTTEEDRKGIVVGWPSSGHGVWILRLQNRDARPRDYGKLGMCVSMDERCAVLETWGAVFYDDPKAVEEFKGLL